MTLIEANPDGLHALPGVVTHVVTVPELGLVYTSGQVAWDKDGNLVGEGDYAKQAEQIVRNLDIALASGGRDTRRSDQANDLCRRLPPGDRAAHHAPAAHRDTKMCRELPRRRPGPVRPRLSH
jgi:Endoribonuclease L-PSP